MRLAPLFFISHGAPTFALSPGRLGPMLQALGQQLSGVNAILVVSPHWQTHQTTVMTTAVPPTVHDFGGFGPALHALQYPAAGHPRWALEAARALNRAGLTVQVDDRRGLDHGAWVPLRFLRPQADLPVFQVSMPVSLDTASAVRLGQALAPLREQGVLIVASGSLTHNLYEFRPFNGEEAPYAREFVEWTRQAVVAQDVASLVAYRRLAPHAARAHPSEEHFLPLLVALGARSDDEPARVLDGGMTYGMLSMESYVWGMPDATLIPADTPAVTEMENTAS